MPIAITEACAYTSLSVVWVGYDVHSTVEAAYMSYLFNWAFNDPPLNSYSEMNA